MGDQTAQNHDRKAFLAILVCSWIVILALAVLLTRASRKAENTASDELASLQSEYATALSELNEYKTQEKQLTAAKKFALNFVNDFFVDADDQEVFLESYEDKCSDEGVLYDLELYCSSRDWDAESEYDSKEIFWYISSAEPIETEEDGNFFYITATFTVRAAENGTATDTSYVMAITVDADSENATLAKINTLSTVRFNAD